MYLMGGVQRMGGQKTDADKTVVHFKKESHADVARLTSERHN